MKKAGAKQGAEQSEADKYKLKHVEKEKQTKEPTTYKKFETVCYISKELFSISKF